MFTGSISVNRITVGLQPTVLGALHEEAAKHGIKVPEAIRHILQNWYSARMRAAEQQKR